jgi:protein-disulfide isomerase
MLRVTVSAALIALTLSLTPAARAEQAAPAVEGVLHAHPLEVLPHDIVIGKHDAPLTIIEYASLTCSHCARFHNETYEQIKKNYLDTGKAKLVFRHMPWDNLAMAASKLSVCANAAAPSYISAFLKSVDTWAKAGDPLGELKKIAKMGGMDEETANKCLQNAEIHQQLLDMQTIGRDILKVRSTPTFFIGANVVIEGFRDYDSFSKALDAELAKLTTNQ